MIVDVEVRLCDCANDSMGNNLKIIVAVVVAVVPYWFISCVDSCCCTYVS